MAAGSGRRDLQGARLKGLPTAASEPPDPRREIGAEAFGCRQAGRAEIDEAGDAFALVEPQGCASARIISRPLGEYAAAKAHGVGGEQKRE